MGARYKIGSFNVHNLSLAVHRDIERIAKIIKQNNLDIIALQEILSEGKRIAGTSYSQSATVPDGMLRRSLMHYLGSSWDCCIGTPDNHQSSKHPYQYLGGDSRGEGYAFLWNKARIELPVISHDVVRPAIWSNYHLKEPGMLRLIRDPLVGRFKLKGRPAEIRLITTHIIFGKPTEDNLAAPIDFGALTLRRNEFKVLAGDIYARVSDYHRDMESVASYTIILGDYNLNLPKSQLKKNLLTQENTETGIVFFDKKGVSTADSTKAERVIHTVQHDLTTLQKGQDGHARDGYASNYDHFSFDESIKDHVLRCYALDAVHGNTTIMSPESYMTATQQPSAPNSPFEVYLKNVSDHLPIVMELDL